MLAVVFSPIAYAQHLGLTAGDSLEVVRRKTTGLKPTSESELYSATSLPQNPAGNDGDYRLMIGRRTGLCKITVYWTIRNDSQYGDGTKKKFKQLETALDKKYGSDGQKFNFTRAGALWDGDNEFMMSLLKKERYQTAYWQSAKGQKLPANTNIISLDTVGTSRSSALIALSYQFKNFSKCEAEKDSADNSML